MSKKKKVLDGFKVKPFYVLKKGDLVRVKEFAREMSGMVGLVLSKEDYNTACDVLFSNGVKRRMMKFTLERVDAEKD
tara:strand:+ start:2223 stop:2453 length:231 start_codon:yes stop_codon:yes gene_type:complete